MRVQGLGPIDHADSSRSKSASRSKVPKEGAEKPASAITDTYEPSTAPERNELISQVRKKIGSGYYNSESVLDDLSYGFADVFNKL